MNAQQHIDQALFELVEAAHARNPDDPDERAKRAQVHATLAVAAATLEAARA